MVEKFNREYRENRGYRRHSTKYWKYALRDFDGVPRTWLVILACGPHQPNHVWACWGKLDGENFRVVGFDWRNSKSDPWTPPLGRRTLSHHLPGYRYNKLCSLLNSLLLIHANIRVLKRNQVRLDTKLRKPHKLCSGNPASSKYARRSALLGWVSGTETCNHKLY